MSALTLRQTGLEANHLIEKYYFLIIPVSLILGFLFAQSLNGMVPYVALLFAYMTFVMATGCSLTEVKQALGMPVPMLLTFIAAHVVAPCIAYALSTAAYGAGSPYVVGFVLFTAIPLGVTSVMWVGLTKGNVPLTLAMVVLDSALSPLVVPLEVRLFFGTAIEFDHVKVMMDMVKIIVIPTILGVIVNGLTQGRFRPWSLPLTGPTSKLALAAVIMANAAAIQPYVLKMKNDILVVVPLSLLLVVLCYGIGFVSSVLLKREELIVTVTYSSGMRNISLGLVIALAYFEPLTAVPVVLSILIQQPMASVNRWCMNRYLGSSLYKKLTGASPDVSVR